ncbi:MAG: hypothetical protein J6T10_13420 [Methanobrevibacter sp.]|nr:hypothetical protein [Methanobrevibacter sp.]
MLFWKVLLMLVLLLKVFFKKVEETFEVKTISWTLTTLTVVNGVACATLKGVDVEKGVLVEILKTPSVLKHGGLLLTSQR